MAGGYSKLARNRKGQTGLVAAGESRGEKRLSVRTVFVWCAVVLAASLYVWDVFDTIRAVWDLRGGVCRGIDFDGKFHLRLWLAEYDPHAGWQLLVWCVGMLIAEISATYRTGIKGAFPVLFHAENKGEEDPGMKTARRIMMWVIVIITGFDIAAWSGDCYWEMIGVPREMKAAAQTKLLKDTEESLETAAAAANAYYQERKKVPKSLAVVEMRGSGRKDGWGGALRLEQEGDVFWVVSAGPDGQFGTDDDLSHEIEFKEQ